ncbi:MAG: acetyl-CoA carboxylase carboxyltransferase subunit alpha [Chloroflexales bacterium]
MDETTNPTEAQELTPWDRVQMARHPQRPHTLDYIAALCEDFTELHGDRRFGDDAAIVGGLATFAERTVMMIGHQKGSDTRENMKRNFGMSHPEGYRKAQRLMRHAEKFGIPVICFVDTPAADPKKESEERGQGNAIAESILVMTNLRTPIVAAVIGEGGSGGALALSVADRILMQENAIFSVAPPEAAASILWRDSAKAPDAARALKLTAQDLYGLRIIDEVVSEPTGGAHQSPQEAITTLGARIRAHLDAISQIEIPTLLSQRYQKYRVIGQYHEA